MAPPSDTDISNNTSDSNMVSIDIGRTTAPVAPVMPLTSPLTQQEIQQNKTFMTIAHFVMTYPRWSLSIFLLLASRSIYLPGSNQAVREPLEHLRSVVSSEADLYRECVQTSFEGLGQVWNETATQEWIRTQHVRVDNMQVLQAVQEQSQECAAVDATARRALQQIWRRDGTNESLVWLAPESSTACDAKDRANLTALLGPNGAIVEDQVSGFLATYIQSSRDSLGVMASYAEDRASYDYDYFVGVKIEGALRLLDVSLSSPDISLSFDQLALLEKLRAALQAIVDALRDARVRVDLLTVRLTEFQVSLEAFYLNYVDLYGRLERLALFIRDFLPAGISLPSDINLGSVPIADFLLPPIFAVPNFPGALLDIDTLVDDFLLKVLEILAELLIELADEASEQLIAVLKALAEQLRGLLTLEDYNPPEFVGSQSGIGSIFDELDFLYDLGEVARLSALNALQKVQQFEPIVFTQAPSLPDLDFRNASFNGNNTSFEYLEPSFPSFTIPDLIEAFFRWIFTYQWIIEIVVQLFRLWKLKKKYEKNATPDLPEIDYGATDEEEAPQSSKTLSFLHVSILKHFMTPWMALALILLPFSILTVTIWFPHVKTNCIDSRNGTFVARNVMSPLFINEASISGNAYYASSEIQCRVNQRRVCNSMFAESDALHRQDLASLFTSTYRQSQSTGNLGVFDRCIEADFLDSQFEGACCGLEGYGTECEINQNTTLCPIDNSTLPASSFRPIGVYLSEPSCQWDVAEWDIEDSRFDCDVLQETCRVDSCTGVDRDLIESLSIEADCQVETYIIKCCLLVMLALYHAIMVNLCTTLAFNGVKHLRWRSLRPDGITFRTQINEDGELVKGGDRDERSARIQKAMKRFELTGRVQIVVASFVFVVWFISFFVIAASVDF